VTAREADGVSTRTRRGAQRSRSFSINAFKALNAVVGLAPKVLIVLPMTPVPIRITSKWLPIDLAAGAPHQPAGDVSALQGLSARSEMLFTPNFLVAP